MSDDRGAVATPPAPGETAGAPQAIGDTTAANIDRQRLAARAYELYLARGASDGRDMEDWLAAERELLGSRGREPNEA